MAVVIAEDGFPHRYPNGKHAYRCEQCGVVSPWGDAWMWWGSIKELEDDATSAMTFCCKDHAKEFERIQPARFEAKPKRGRP